MTNPIVTSSGKRILSPMLINLPPPATGIIRKANERLMQKPAPPVANQNFTLGSDILRFFCWMKLNFDYFDERAKHFPFKLHIPDGFPMGMLRWAFPNTIPLLDCTRLISWPSEAHLHNCRRRNGKTIWKKKMDFSRILKPAVESMFRRFSTENIKVKRLPQINQLNSLLVLQHYWSRRPISFSGNRWHWHSK